MLDISVINPSSISAFDIILAKSSISGGAAITIDSVTWFTGFTVLTNRIIDLSRPDTIRVAGMMTDPGDVCLPADYNNTVAHVYFETNDACDGVVEIDAATITCAHMCTCGVPCCTTLAYTHFIDCATTTVIPVLVNKGVLTFHNYPPFWVICPPDTNLHACETWQFQILADDADLVKSCERLTYSKLVGPPDLFIDPNTGLITYPVPCADIGIQPVTIRVTDSCGAFVDCNFEICVFNLRPVVDFCPNDTLIGWGDTYNATVLAHDQDLCMGLLTYSILSFTDSSGGFVTPHHEPTVNEQGEVEWITTFDSMSTGWFRLCILVDDGAPIVPGCSPENADTCCFSIRVVPFLITIEKEEGPHGDGVIQGQFTEVEITMLNSGYSNYPMGGFDFLIAFDRSALNFHVAKRGLFLDHCGWEYFTYRWWMEPSYFSHFFWGGIVKMVAMAETNNGAAHPSCFTNETDTVSEQLAVVQFLVTSNQQFECQFVPIRFFWKDCTDNVISSVSGDTLFIERYVYEWYFDETTGHYKRIDNLPELYPDLYSDSFPTYFGVNDKCDTTWKPPNVVLSKIDFQNGGVDIICADAHDARGDVNLNGIANEVADAVVFTNYFIYGFSAFHLSVDGQTAATDVNADGLTLTVGDLVYLIRVIVGDDLPYPKLAPVEANYTVADGVLSVDKKMGAALVVVRGEVTPALLSDNMDIKYAYNAEENVTRVLVYSLAGNGFSGEFLNANGDVVSIELGSYEGAVVKATEVPADFALHQNYPNPFNPTTTISFSLPTATNYALTVYNVSGQEVERFVGTHEAGVVELEWNAENVASGIYFYKLDAGSFTATKKMVLLK